MTDDGFDALPRPLPFPLREAVNIYAETPDGLLPEGVFVWPEDSDERTTVTFELSLNEFVALASAIDVGSDIAYSSQATLIWWIWVRSFNSMPICAAIINCIQTDSDVRAAIRDFVLNDPAINKQITDIASNQVLSLENRLTNLLKPDECDPDFIFNQASVLVQLLHDLTEDMFEAIEVGTNQLERADILVTAVPAAGLNDTAATAFKVADQIVEEIQEDYMGAYDEAMYDTLRCAVFCACKDDCELSLTKIINVYQGLLEGEVPSDPIQALVYVMQYIVTGDIPTDANVYIMHLLMLTAIQAGTDLLGVDFSRLANRILAAGDDPNNDWLTLCEDCPESDCYQWDLTETSGTGDSINGTNDFGPTYGTSVWANGIGYQYQSLDNRAASVKITFASPLYVRNFSFTVGANPDSGTLFRHYSRVDGGSESFMTPNSGNPRRATREIGLEISSISTLVEVPETFLAPPIINLQIEFDGDMPAWTEGTNC